MKRRVGEWVGRGRGLLLWLDGLPGWARMALARIGGSFAWQIVWPRIPLGLCAIYAVFYAVDNGADGSPWWWVWYGPLVLMAVAAWWWLHFGQGSKSFYHWGQLRDNDPWMRRIAAERIIKEVQPILEEAERLCREEIEREIWDWLGPEERRLLEQLRAQYGITDEDPWSASRREVE